MLNMFVPLQRERVCFLFVFLFYIVLILQSEYEMYLHQLALVLLVKSFD